jgi:hypothetical protein
LTSKVAALQITAVNPDGRRFTIDIEVGAPYPDPKQKRPWWCPVTMRGLHDRLPDIGGEDSFQALCLALSFIRRRLVHARADGVRLLIDENGSEADLRLEAYFP